MPLTVAGGLLSKWSVAAVGEKCWLAAGNVMIQLMFGWCCYSWFVKGTWRVSYCTGKAMEKLSWERSEIDISPFQGHSCSVALHFQDTFLKGRTWMILLDFGASKGISVSWVPGQGWGWLYELSLCESCLKAGETSSFRAEIRKSPRCLQREVRSLSQTQNTSSPRSTGAVRHTSPIWLFTAFSHSRLFYLYSQRGTEKGASAFKWGWSRRVEECT